MDVIDRDPKGQWIDFVVLGELYRWMKNKKIVLGPDGTEYPAEFFAEEWGVELVDRPN